MPASKNIVVRKFAMAVPLNDGTLQNYSDQLDALQLQLNDIQVQRTNLLLQLNTLSKEMYDYYVTNY
jgi:hypothetical protein